MNQIKFNERSGKFEVTINGKVRTSPNRKYLERQLQRSMSAPEQQFVVEQDSPKVTFGINERFEFIEKFVKMVARGISHSLIITGDGGLGKTHTVLQTLSAMGKVEMGIGDMDGDFVSSRVSAPRRLSIATCTKTMAN